MALATDPMTGLRARVLCGAAIGFGTVATVLSWYLLALTPDLPWTQVVSMLLFAVPPLFTALGTVIVRRGHGHRTGWLLVATGTALGVDVVAATAAQPYIAGVDVPFGVWLTWSDDFVWAPLLFGTWMIALTFPDGHLPTRLSRVVAWTGAAVAGAIVVLVPFRAGRLIDYPSVTSPVPPVPVLTPLARAVVPFLQPCVPLMFLLVAVSVVVRYRSAGPVARAQIRWLAWWALLLGILIPLRLVFDERWLPVLDVASAVAWPMLPAVVAVAVLRYRLYDVDRLVSRTLSYAVLTGVVVALYAAVVTAASTVLHTSGPLGVAAATLAAVSVVRPLRRRLQTVVDRRFDRARHDAHRAVDGYVDRLRSADPDRDHEADLLEVLDRTVAPRQAFLWVPAPARPTR